MTWDGGLPNLALQLGCSLGFMDVEGVRVWASEWRPYSRDAVLERREESLLLGEDLHGEETYLFLTFPLSLC